MDFSNFDVAGPSQKEVKKRQPRKRVNPKQVKEKQVEEKKSNSSIRQSKEASPSYIHFPKVFQGCERCEIETLHIISKKHHKIRCTICNYTYVFETTE